jgi:DNA repair protein RecN (Recombination protein N)
MLSRLEIKNFVLIDHVVLEIKKGFTAMTGETGAGKSILLDAMGFALGARADVNYIRAGKDQADIALSFEFAPKAPMTQALNTLLAEHDIAFDVAEPLTIRRVMSRDGKNKAYLNDQAVNSQLLKKISPLLIEIHGQFDTHGLINQNSHMPALDRFGRYDLSALKKAAEGVIAKTAELDALKAAARTSEDDQAFYRHAIAELKKMALEEGEVQKLSDLRQKLMAKEKLTEALENALSALKDDDGANDQVDEAFNALTRSLDKAGQSFDHIFTALDVVRDQLATAVEAIESELYSLRDEEHDANSIEERLFAIKAAARKYQCQPDQLVGVLNDFEMKIKQIDNFDAALLQLEKELKALRKIYDAEALRISGLRQEAALRFDQAVMKELKPLKLDKAKFRTDITVDPNHISIKGIDQVQFLVTTNPGLPEGAINKIASGGELARFMLALKVALADQHKENASTLIFDEIDTGVGGAVADAIGERLQRLGKEFTVLAVTHSPQVAARAHHHQRSKPKKHANKNHGRDR